MKKKLTHRQLIKELLLFLKKEGAYEEYIKNVKKLHRLEFQTWEHYINMFSIKTFNEAHISQYINYGFIWSQTKQGHAYWDRLNKKWMYKLHEFEII